MCEKFLDISPLKGRGGRDCITSRYGAAQFSTVADYLHNSEYKCKVGSLTHPLTR